jgi:RAVE protein 1 C terminal
MQDVLLNELSERFEFESTLNYDILKLLCVPLWLKDTPKLKNLVTIIAKNEYRTGGDDFGKTSKAERTALWYIMLDKKDQLIRLYK